MQYREHHGYASWVIPGVCDRQPFRTQRPLSGGTLAERGIQVRLSLHRALGNLIQVTAHSCYLEGQLAFVDLVVTALAGGRLLPATAGARCDHPLVERPAFPRQRTHIRRGVEQPVQYAQAFLFGNHDLPHGAVRNASAVGNAVFREPAAKAIPNIGRCSNEMDPQVRNLLSRPSGGEVYRPVTIDQAPHECSLVLGR